MHIVYRGLAVLLSTCALIVTCASGALAATNATLRVVGEQGEALDPGTSYETDVSAFKTREDKCDGSGKTLPAPAFPSAMGLVQDAAKKNARLDPFWVSDKYSFGLIVCQIGAAAAFDASEAWLYKVNHKEAQVGGDQYALNNGDQVLWYFANFATGENTGRELALDAPKQARANESFSVRATVYDSAANQSPAAGVSVAGPGSPAVTGPDGRTTVTPGREGTITLRATRHPDIPAAPVEVRVDGASAASPVSSPPSRSDPGTTNRSDATPRSASSPRVSTSDGGNPHSTSRSDTDDGTNVDSGGASGSDVARDDRPALPLSQGVGSSRPSSSRRRAAERSSAAPTNPSIGELLSATAYDPKAPRSSNPPPARRGGAPLVALFVILGAAVLVAVGAFFARKVIRARALPIATGEESSSTV